MQNRPIVPALNRGNRGRLSFCVCFSDSTDGLPLAESSPAAFVATGIVNSHIPGRHTGLFSFIDDTIVQRHRLRAGLIDSSIVESTISEDRDGDYLG